MSEILFFGLGYSVTPLAERLVTEGHRVIGTTRSQEKADTLKAKGIEPALWDAGQPVPADWLGHADTMIISVAPDKNGCPVAQALGDAPLRKGMKILYLSSSGVYGDHDGAWVDEETVPLPDTERGHRRLAAEHQWQVRTSAAQATLTLCRLAGIYGPGRNAIESLQDKTAGAKAGLAQRIIKPGQVFNRIHRDDISGGLYALLHHDSPPDIVNFSDDEPSPPQDVISFAAELLAMEPPPAVPFEEAEMSPMARSFYRDNKRLRNDRLKAVMGPLTYPTYREGLKALNNI